MILADINFADIMWSMIAFFFFVIILSMVFQIIGDIFRSDDLSGVSKAIWCIAIILVPWLAIFVYLITRGSGMPVRARKSNQAAQDQFAPYAASVAPPVSSATGEIMSAKELLDSGAISQAEFDRIKAAALATT
jgi:type VI protein secretion system component VasK